MTGKASATDLLWELSQQFWANIEQILMKEGTRISAPQGPHRRNGDGVTVVKDPYYILASSPLGDERGQVLKHGDTFAIFDHYGDIKPVGLGEEGLYHEGTRFLSCLGLRLLEERPLMLSSTVRDDNALLTVNLTNPDIYERERVIIRRGVLHILRSKFLWQGTCYERIIVQNYGMEPVSIPFALYFEADFADIFEVRGTKRKQRGDLLPPERLDNGILLSYRGLDGVLRRTRVGFWPQADTVTDSGIHFTVALPPQGTAMFDLTVSCEATEPPPRFTFATALQQASASCDHAHLHWCDIHTSNEQFNDWVNRSRADLDMMTTQTPQGPYPYAGVPWFSTAFGRDGIITALECLWLHPDLARGVLSYLAAHQATEVSAEQDAAPGKILHETRRGEMAALKEIPFGRYYGSVDATPLFVVLAGAYYDRTADRELVEKIWPNIEAALSWIDNYGDVDGDGLFEYARQSPTGLVQQGWKDSHDSVYHADGSLAEAPIALCEVQGYVYAAWLAAARLANVLGHAESARRLTERAAALRAKFDHEFWCEELGTYALALDGRKRACRVRSSNAGQCLFTGIVPPERVPRLTKTLFEETSYSGWGIRTIATSEARYNPMSYHNGSIWPHDNALVALGLAQHRQREGALQILTGLFDASLFVDLHRMPELFCGFPRRDGEGPTLYPVACAPQAWAAGAVFLVLQAALGLEVSAYPPRVQFTHPRLPGSLKQVWIRNLKVGKAELDLRLERQHESVGIEILRREGAVDVVSIK